MDFLISSRRRAALSADLGLVEVVGGWGRRSQESFLGFWALLVLGPVLEDVLVKELVVAAEMVRV